MRSSSRTRAETGLYADLASGRISDAFVPFEPAFELWSDGAHKRRWLFLPNGTAIDRSDMDHWRFPVGTVAVKEFARAGKRLETRVIARLSDDEYFMGAFAWDRGRARRALVQPGDRGMRSTGLAHVAARALGRGIDGRAVVQRARK